jgi:hypothetical protein
MEHSPSRLFMKFFLSCRSQCFSEQFVLRQLKPKFLTLAERNRPTFCTLAEICIYTASLNAWRKIYTLIYSFAWSILQIFEQDLKTVSRIMIASNPIWRASVRWRRLDLSEGSLRNQLLNHLPWHSWVALSIGRLSQLNSFRIRLGRE